MKFKFDSIDQKTVEKGIETFRSDMVLVAFSGIASPRRFDDESYQQHEAEIVAAIIRDWLAQREKAQCEQPPSFRDNPRSHSRPR